jgi:hypothetical protein
LKATDGERLAFYAVHAVGEHANYRHRRHHFGRSGVGIFTTVSKKPAAALGRAGTAPSTTPTDCRRPMTEVRRDRQPPRYGSTEHLESQVAGEASRVAPRTHRILHCQLHYATQHVQTDDENPISGAISLVGLGTAYRTQLINRPQCVIETIGRGQHRP